MTHIETARVNEALGLQIGIIRDLAQKLDSGSLQELETDLDDLEKAVSGLREILAGLPFKHS